MYIEPKEIQIDGKAFVIHKLPCMLAIEVQAKWLNALLPKITNFAEAEEMMVKVMAYVCIKRPNQENLFLGSRELIDNHCVSYKTYLKVLEAMREYNELFFWNGSASDFYEKFIQTLPVKILQMLTPLLQQSSTPDSQPSTS